MRKKENRSFNRLVFGQRLKSLRESIGLTQEDMGHAIGRTRVSYSLIEAGKAAPSIDCMMDIVKVLEKKGINVTMDYMCNLTANPSINQKISQLAEENKRLAKELATTTELYSLQKRILDKG